MSAECGWQRNSFTPAEKTTFEGSGSIYQSSVYTDINRNTDNLYIPEIS